MNRYIVLFLIISINLSLVYCYNTLFSKFNKFLTLKNTKYTHLFNNNLLLQFDTEEVDSFVRISSNYLKSKLIGVSGDNKPITKDIISEVLQQILPPVSINELKQEIDTITNSFNNQNFNENDLINSIINNSYWSQAGPIVVQELIYLDCLYNYYQKRQNLLNDEDYQELKSQLNWSGSDIVTMTGKEALFITSVAANRRGIKLLDDTEYELLKKQLQNVKSWVVLREADGLEKLGVNTYLGYLHRSFK